MALGLNPKNTDDPGAPRKDGSRPQPAAASPAAPVTLAAAGALAAPVTPDAAAAPVAPAAIPAPAAKRRKLSIGVTVALYVASAVAVWAVLALLTSRYAPRPWDVTKQRDFTLAPETRELLKRVNKPLRFTVVFGKAGDVRQHVVEETESLLDLFKTESRWVESRRLDPDRDPAGVYELTTRLRIENDPQKYRDTVAVEYGDRSLLVPSSRIAVVELVREGRKTVLQEKSFQGEFAFASAVLNLLEEQTLKVYFTAGHGELDTDDPNTGGMQYAKAALREEKFQVDTLYLLEKDEIPSDAAAVVVAAPQEPFDVQETVKLEKFLARGGGLFVCVAPRRFTNLETLLQRYGVELGQDIVVDPANKRASRSPTDLIVRKVGNHPVTAALGTSTLEVPACRSVRRFANNAVLDPKLQRTELCFSSEKSWAETDFTQFPKVTRNVEAGDLNGPVPLAMAVAIGADSSDPRRAAQGGVRLAVFGSREVFTNFWLARAPSNGDLFQNAINWLARRDRLASVRPRSPDLRPLALTEEQAQRLALLAYAGIPLVFLVSGIVVLWRRRA